MGFVKSILQKLTGFNDEIRQLYKDHGPCSNEYIDAYIANCKNPRSLKRVMIADMLISADRFEEAEEMLGTVKLKLLTNGSVKALHTFARINLFMRTGRKSRALAVFYDNRGRLSAYFRNPYHEKAAGAFWDMAARLYAFAGEQKDAMYCFEHEKQWAKKHEPRFPIFTRITYAAILKELKMEILDEEYALVRRLIEEYDGFSYPWQREHSMKLLENAVNE